MKAYNRLVLRRSGYIYSPKVLTKGSNSGETHRWRQYERLWTAGVKTDLGRKEWDTRTGPVIPNT